MAAVCISLLLLLLLQSPADADDGVCINRFLVTVSNQTRGVDVRIFPGVNSNKDWPSYDQKEITGYFLPPECGKDYFKCDQPLVVSSTSTLGASATQREQAQQSYVVIVPLAKSIALLKLEIGIDGMLYFKKDLHIINLSGPKYDCSPTSVYHIRSSYYVVCPNSNSEHIKLLELRLNTTKLDESHLPVLENPHIDSTPNLTNSLYINMEPDGDPVIFFTTGYEMYFFRPIDYLIESWDIRLRDDNCYATSIEYIGESEMIVHCKNDRAVYVDLNRESIFATVEYSKDGQPYVCPNPDVYLGVNTVADYIVYALRSSQYVKNFNIPMLNFNNGICLGSQNETLFAYTDRETGVHLLNISNSLVTTLSTTSCINYSCQPLVVLQERYLVIREKRGASWFVLVLDSTDNFSLALEAQHSEADLMALIETVNTCREPTATPTVNVYEGGNQKAATGSHDSQTQRNQSVIIGSCVGAGVIIVIIVVAVAISLFFILRNKLPVIMKSLKKKKTKTDIAQSHEQSHIYTEELVLGTVNVTALEMDESQVPSNEKLSASSSDTLLIPTPVATADGDAVEIPMDILENKDAASQIQRSDQLGMAAGDQAMRKLKNQTSNPEANPLLNSSSSD